MTAPTGILFVDPQIKPLSPTGAPQAAAYQLFFLTGTLTPANVYADGALTTPLSQTPGAPQPSCTADSAGRFNPIYLNPATTYRVQQFNSSGGKLEDVDPYVVPGGGNYQSTYGTVPASLAAVLSSVETPVNYGAYYGDGIHDDTVTLTAFYAHANTNLSGPPNGWVNGIVPGSPLISATVPIPGTALAIWYGGQPTASSSFTSGGTPYVNDCMFNITGTDMDIYNPTFDGSYAGTTCLANGFSVNGARIRIHEITGTHYPLYGVALNSGFGDNHIYGHQLQQWENGDTPFLLQTNFTADGIYINTSDCSVHGGYSRWNKCGVHCGPLTGATLIYGIHFYGGNSGLSTTPNPFLDPINIQVDAGAIQIYIQHCYLDNGHVDLYSPFVTLRDCLFLQNRNCNFSVDANGVPNYIRLYANGNSAAYALDIDVSTFNLESTNTPNNSNATSPFGHLPCPSTTATTSAASATGTATLGVASWVGPQPGVSSEIIVAGVTPSGFNGTYQVTAVTSNSVSYANSTAGPQTVAGTVQCTWVGTYSAEAALFTNTSNDLEVRGSTVKIWTRGDNVIPEVQELKGFDSIVNTWQIGAGAANTDTKAASSRVLSCPLGVNGNAAPAQVTGFGTPVGYAVINNYNITDAGGSNSNTNKAVAQIIKDLKAFGIYGA
jgi:hypothetical protein